MLKLREHIYRFLSVLALLSILTGYVLEVRFDFEKRSHVNCCCVGRPCNCKHDKDDRVFFPANECVLIGTGCGSKFEFRVEPPIKETVLPEKFQCSSFVPDGEFYPVVETLAELILPFEMFHPPD